MLLYIGHRASETLLPSLVSGKQLYAILRYVSSLPISGFPRCFNVLTTNVLASLNEVLLRSEHSWL